MKLSFSTLACPDFSWTEIYSMAKDFGLDGIEVRGLGKELSAIHAAPFEGKAVDATLLKLKELNLAISCFSSGCPLKNKENEEKNIKELKEYILLAGRFSTPFVRILGDLEPQPTGEVDDAYIVSVLKKLAPFASIYWLAVTAGFLAWSFITMRWDRTWIVWPIAGVLFGVVTGIIKMLKNKG